MKETNMEHFRGEIEAEGYRFGVVDGKIVDCWEISCDACDIGKPECTRKKIKWLMSEYEIVLTEREKNFVEFAKTGWLVREYSILHWFKEKPIKEIEKWSGTFKQVLGKPICGDIFLFVTDDDEEPWSVEDLRKLKVGDQDA